MTSQLQYQTEEDRQQNGQSQTDDTSQEITLGDRTLDLDVPAAAEADETAAIAAAIAAHLSAERQAAQRKSTDTAPTVDPWTMSGRYRSPGSRKVKAPSRSAPSTGWKFAARAHMFER